MAFTSRVTLPEFNGRSQFDSQKDVQFWFSWSFTFKIFLNYQILNMDLGLKFSYHWSPVKFTRWLASLARSLQFQSKLKHFLCWKCPRGWTCSLSNHKQPKSEPKLHLTFHLMENLWWLLKQGEFIFGVFPVYYRLITEK